MRAGSKWMGAAALALLAGCGGDGALSGSDIARADALYTQHCAACHDKEGTSAPLRAALRTRTPEAIVASLENGLMREQGKALSGEGRKLIAAYLGSGGGVARSRIWRAKASDAAVVESSDASAGPAWR